MQTDQVVEEVESVPEQELKVDEPELDVLAVQTEAQKLLNKFDQSQGEQIDQHSEGYQFSNEEVDLQLE